ncbi:MAG: aspartate-semialdehyde dehydrogenase, partial [Calditrichota bacterium]
VVSTYQGVTGSGKKAVEQLSQELEGNQATNPAYPHPIANNCLPHIDRFFEDGYTREEHKMVHETRKIMGIANLPVSATCVRIPVTGGHSESVNIEFNQDFELRDIMDALSNAPGVIITDAPTNNQYPMPLTAHEKDAVFVGRIRKDPSIASGLNMWVVSDNLRKGAATNTIQIAEALIKQGLLNVRRAG